MKTTILLLLGFLLIAPVFADWQNPTDEETDAILKNQEQLQRISSKSDIIFYKVTRVIDGDTIQLEDGSRLRYCGINTPETKDPHRPVEFMGKEAYQFNKKLVEGKKVRLEFDVEKKDKYGRLLAYVYVKTNDVRDIPEFKDRTALELMVNAELVKQGYAQASTYPPNVKHADQFRKLENEARNASRGLWSDLILVQKKEDYYIASKNSQLFHRPDCPYAKDIANYNRVKYKSREEAVKVGKMPCSGCKP